MEFTRLPFEVNIQIKLKILRNTGTGIPLPVSDPMSGVQFTGVQYIILPFLFKDPH